MTTTITVGAEPAGVKVTADGSRLLVGNSGRNSTTISVIDTASRAVVEELVTGARPWAIAVTGQLHSRSTAHCAWNINAYTFKLIITMSERESGMDLVLEKRRGPTAADVARAAGVSAATVSYVLNNVAGQKISESTRSAVCTAAEQLGYRPNLAARNLRVGGSGVILFVIPPMGLSELPRRPDPRSSSPVGETLARSCLPYGVSR